MEGHCLDQLFASLRQYLETQYDIDLTTLSSWSVVVIGTILAVYLGYAYLQSLAEAPVSFNVPLPKEIRADWIGTTWDELTGDDKKLVEDQIHGVRLALPLSLPLSPSDPPYEWPRVRKTDKTNSNKWIMSLEME